MKKALADALEARGYTALTPVQEAVNKAELIGVDMLVSAQTGSGKTVGFGLAIAPTLLGEDEVFETSGAPLALVIAPTRELALQVKRELGWLYANAGVVMASCVGGMDMRDERRTLSRGAHIVVATPGRLRDHIMRGSIDLSALRAIVLDEADEMLDLGFREDLEFILGECPDDRQTLLFSATVPASIGNLAKNYQRDAVRVVTKSETSQHADIEYLACSVSDRDTDNAIINTLRFYEAPNAIVFCNTRAMVNRLTTRLSNRGFSVVALSGELSQNERTHALQAMRDGRARVCVATDVAARGIDLPNLDLVVHAELPTNHETLLHRSGRTGRAGRKGVSVLIVPPKARKKAQRILGTAKVRADWANAPSADAVRARDEERMLADDVWQEPISDQAASGVAQLVERFSAEQIANAYLQLFHANHSAPEEISGVTDEKPQPRVAFGPSAWFSVPGGRSANAEPRRLLPMLCKFGDITKDDIGAIRIQQDETFVEIKESSVAGFVKSVGPELVVEDGAVMTRLNGAPNLGAPQKRFEGGPRSAPAKHGGPRKGPRPDKPEARSYDQKPRSEERKPRSDAKPYGDKPKRGHSDAAPAREKRPAPRDAANPSAPIVWDDERKPRQKKPKAGQGPAKGKPQSKSRSVRVDGVVTDFSAKRKPKGEEGAGSRGGGPRPPVGKASSKKNRERAKTGKSGKGGTAPPRRS